MTAASRDLMFSIFAVGDECSSQTKPAYRKAQGIATLLSRRQKRRRYDIRVGQSVGMGLDEKETRGR